MLRNLNNTHSNSMVTNKRPSEPKEEEKFDKQQTKVVTRDVKTPERNSTPKKERSENKDNANTPKTGNKSPNPEVTIKNNNVQIKNNETILNEKKVDKNPKEVAERIKSEDSLINQRKLEEKQAVNEVKNNIPKSDVNDNSKQHMTQFQKNAEIKKELSQNEAKLIMSNQQSKDKIKIFKDEDDSDIEKHLVESRKRLKDPMDNVNSDGSNPPTPIKSPPKERLRTTEESAAISEAGVFDRGKSNVIRQDPFDYTMNKDMIFSVNDRNENLELYDPSIGRINDTNEETKILEDKVSTARLGNVSTTNQGKDKINVLNSDSDSEEGDPRYRIGSRFSSYHNEIKANEQQSMIIEQIPDQIKEEIIKVEERQPKSIANGFMSEEFELKNSMEKEEAKRQSIIETMENEEFEEVQGKLKTDTAEKINFNTIEEDEINENAKLISPKNFEDDNAEEMKSLVKKKTGDESANPKEEVKDYLESKDYNKRRKSSFNDVKMESNPTHEVLDSSINDLYGDGELYNRKDSSIEETKALASNYIKNLLQM